MRDMSPRLRVAATLGFLVFWGIPFPVASCEPIFPLTQLLSGSTMAGPLYLTRSLGWLGVAVVFKCIVFVVMEPRLPWRKGACWMLLANVFSTIPGVFVAVFTGSLVGVLVALVLVYVIGWMVRGRIRLLFGPYPPLWISGGGAALLFTAFFFVSGGLYQLAGSALSASGFTSYWILKYLFVTLAATTGMLISVVLEEYVIARLAQDSHRTLIFFKPVFRANYVVLMVILLVAAWQLLPQRLKDPHLIVTWRQIK